MNGAVNGAVNGVTTIVPEKVPDSLRDEIVHRASTCPESHDFESHDPESHDPESRDPESHGLESHGFENARLTRASATGVEPYPPHVLLDLLILVFRSRPVILRTTLAVAVLASILALVLPNRYTATAKILPPQQSPSLAASMIGQLGAFGPMAAMAQKDFGLKNPNDLYVGLLESRTAEDAVIHRFDLQRVYRARKMSDAREELEKASSILLGKEGFVSISVEDRDRSRAPQIANAYVDELRQLTQTLAVTEAGQRRIFFERQLELAENNLAGAEQALKQTEEKTGLIQLEGQAKAVIESVGKLRAAIAAQEIQLHAMRLFSTEENPDVQLGEQQLSGMRAQLARMEKPGSGPDDVFSAGSVPAGNVPEAGLQYVRKLREVKYAETMFEMLAKQYEAARLDEAKTAAVIQVLDPAIEPDRRSSPHRTLIVVVGTVLGFCGSVLTVLSREALHRLRLNPGVESRLAKLKTAVFQPRFQPKP